MVKKVLSNPYVVGQTIIEDYGFYGRQKLVDEVVNTFTNTRHNAVVLHGQRRIGKSSFIHRLRRDEQLQESYVPIFFDLQQFPGAPLARLLSELAERIIYDSGSDLPLVDEETFSSDPRYFLRQLLPDVYQHIGEKRLLILMDEFDVAVPEDIAERIPGDTFIGYLQNIMGDGTQPLSFVFVVGQRLDLLAEGYRRLFRSTLTQPVGRLDQNDGFELLMDLGKVGEITYADEALTRMWDLTNGHPYLNQLLGYEVFERLQRDQRTEVQVDDVDNAIDDAMAHGQGALDWFWTGFNRNEQLVLAAIAEKTAIQPNINQDEIDEILRQYTLFVNEVDLRQACKQLTEGDFLEETSEGQYKFAVEFIRRWIINNHSLAEVKKEVGKRDPQALRHYHDGQRLFERGSPREAASEFHQAIQIDSHFIDARRGLARSLSALGKMQESLAEWEMVYNLDPPSVRKDYIEILLSYISQLDGADSEDEALIYANRILKIDERNSEARRAIGHIHLRRAQLLVDSFKANEATKILENLKKPVSIISDVEVAQAVRQLWHTYSQTLIDLNPPRLNKAQAALNNLIQFDLLDSETSQTYNDIILAKAQILLEKDQLNDTLALLEIELRTPFEVGAIRNLLQSYSAKQIELQRWPQAIVAVEGMHTLMHNEQSVIDLLECYRQFGAILANQQNFGEAIRVYRKGHDLQHAKFDFFGLICDTYLAEGHWHVDRDKLDKAEQAYQQALEFDTTETTAKKIHDKLYAYFSAQCHQQHWIQANQGRQLFENLGIFQDKHQAWRETLALNQAISDLSNKRIGKAFKHLTSLKNRDDTKIKTLIQNYLKDAASRNEWAEGEAVLNRLVGLLKQDREMVSWQANWLFSWSRVITNSEQSEQHVDQAKTYAQRALVLCDEDTVVIDLTTDTSVTRPKEVANLRKTICSWLAKITLNEAQTCLNYGDINQGQVRLKEVLGLPHPPDKLANTIQAMLKAVSETYARKGDWVVAQAALQSILDLGLGGTEINQILKKLTLNKATQQFKADEPGQAFATLHYLKQLDMNQAECDQVEKTAYQFSRLYAGRTLWPEAGLTLEQLGIWLEGPKSNKFDHEINMLNQEQLHFVKGKRLNATNHLVSTQSITLLAQELQIIENSYRKASKLQITQSVVLQDWLDRFVETVLALGKAHLSNKNETEAILVYGKIANQADDQSLYPHLKQSEQWLSYYLRASLALGEAYLAKHDIANAERAFQKLLDEQDNIPEATTLYQDIAQYFYDYCEKIIHDDQPPEKWEKAEAVLNCLRLLNIPAPYGTLASDFRIEGTRQRIILLQIQHLLADNKLKDTFIILKQLPEPWPDGELKKMIWHYSDTQCQEHKWENAQTALQSLHQFFGQNQKRGYDQNTLGKLVDTLTSWGQSLEQAEKLPQAAEKYQQAVPYSRAIGQPKSTQAAENFIRVTFALAQDMLQLEASDPERSSNINRACKKYTQILSLPEHTRTHEAHLNQSLYEQVVRATESAQWDEAQQILDQLQHLYPASLTEYQHQFATWYADLILAETNTLLTIPNLGETFARLVWLNEWLKEQAIFEAIWPYSLDKIKCQIDRFTAIWFDIDKFDLAIQALNSLTMLSPNDSEVKGWQVKARCKWGQWAYENGQYNLALAQYEKAADMVSTQNIVSLRAINDFRIDALLAQAAQTVVQDESALLETVALYKQVLKYRHDEVEPVDRIRLTLKGVSDRLVQDSPPHWILAHLTLYQLVKLNLHNDDVALWQQKLTIKEIKAHLTIDDLKSAFATLERMERPWPTEAVQGLVQQYCYHHTKVDTYQLAIETLQTLGDMIAEDQAWRQWVIDELMAVGDMLDEQGNLSAAAKAYGVAVDFS